MANLRSQVNALVRKNAVYQKRNWVANGCLICAPIVICLLLVLIQALVNNQLDKPENKCGCKCLSCCKDVDTCTTDSKGVEECTTRQECWDDAAQCLPGMYDTCRRQNDDECGIEYSSEDQAGFCGIAHPTIYPTFQLVPEPGDRGSAANGPSGGVQPLASGEPLPIFLTGSNPQVSQEVFNLMYASPSIDEVVSLGAGLAAAAATNDLGKAVSDAGLVFGTPKDVFFSYLVDPALLGEELYALATDCTNIPEIGGTVNAADVASIRVNITCTPVVSSLQPDVATINKKLYCGWKDARCEGVRETSGFASPVDFKDTSATKLSFNYWTNYTSTIGGNQPDTIMRANQVMGLVYSAFVKWATGGAGGGTPRFSSALVGIADFPTVSKKLTLDFSSLLGPLFYTWLLMMLLPIMIVQLVYEKQNHLRSMMKMHGLSEVTYWLVMCSWYFVLHIIFVALILIVGSAVNLKFFRLNSYAVQIVFYFIFTLNQISLACLASTVYTSARTAVVTTFVYVFGTGLVANLLMDQFYGSNKWYNTFFYLFPPFNLYRAMYEFGEYSFRAAYVNGSGLTFGRFSDDDNDMWQVLLIFALQAPLFLLMAWYFSAVLPGNGVRRHWLFCLPGHSSRRRHAEHTKDSRVVDMPHADKNVADGPAGDGPVLSSSHRYSTSARWKLDADADVEKEAEVAMTADPRVTPIVLRDVRKVYPPRDGQPEKAALNGVSLTVKKGECFGLLGPNGAGKSTCINVMVGLQEATGGEVFIAGHDLSEGKTDVYKSMGVCPQDNLLWDNLTAREHLSFYGRLKGLEGAELKQAVDAALASVQLTAAGNKRSKTYSGGMKRRLSVAISLMGNPQVAYLDEPSTGLDPASRHALWTAVKSVKKDYAIILTTHSMQEAEILCDRLGIIVNGRLICIGNPRELTAAYGNYLEFSITVPPSQVEQATAFVKGKLCASAVCTYALAGTLRFELPTGQVNVHDVFQAMHDVEEKRQLTVLDWGLANATLEEVFIKVARHVSATSTD